LAALSLVPSVIDSHSLAAELCDDSDTPKEGLTAASDTSAATAIADSHLDFMVRFSPFCCRLGTTTKRPYRIKDH
jgi:hypothetical protein